MDDTIERALAELPRELRVLLAQAPAGLAYVDKHQRFRFANERFHARLAPVHPRGVIGLHVSEVSGSRYANIRPYIERALSGHAASHEERVKDLGPGTAWLRSVLVPDVENGEVVGYVLMTIDITRSKEAEIALDEERKAYAQRLESEVAERTAQLRALQRRLVDAERLSAAEETAGAVAHAIHNPLTALLGTVEMAQEAMLDAKTALGRIRLLAKRIEEVVEGTLWLYRRGEMKLRPESPQSLVESVELELMSCARALDVKIVSSAPPSLPLVLADRTLLVSALVCIVENALQASPTQDCVLIDTEAIGDGVRIRISDDGPGIPAHLRQKVLEPFFTTKHRGTGFGLAIASAVIQGHGGSLQIQDRPERGTCIEIELQSAQAPAQPSTDALDALESS